MEQTNVTYPLSFLAHQLADPAFAAMRHKLGPPKHLALDLFRHAFQLVAEALDVRPRISRVHTVHADALELTGPSG